MQNNFKQLEGIVLEILKSGRPNWDIPHTLASVYYMNELLKIEFGNLDTLASLKLWRSGPKGYVKVSDRILISTMYLHDIGYSRSQGDFNTREGTVTAKDDHMKNGVIIARPILEKLNYTKDEIDEILYLISVHDNIEELSSENEILVFEADSLAQIDISRARSNFTGNDKIEFIKKFEEKRLPRFKTKTGKDLAQKLFKEAKEFYSN